LPLSDFARTLALLSLALVLVPGSASADCDLSGFPEGTEIARLELSVGTVCFELLRDDAPRHVDNFLWYLDNGQLNDTFFHRYVDGFVFQGGSFRVGEGDYDDVPTRSGVFECSDPDEEGTVCNEPCTLDDSTTVPGDVICSERGNDVGSVALAKLGGQPHSGTTGWFVNLGDNRASLDDQNGGFTVFARVTPDTMPVIEGLASLPAASGDDNYWLTPTLTGSGVWAPRLTERPEYDLPGFGCFRADQTTVVVDPDLLPNTFAGLDDPATGGFPWIVSSACGSAIERLDFVANPGGESCPDADVLGVKTTGPDSLDILPDSIDPNYFSFTCEEVAESTTQRELWRDAFLDEFNSKLIFIVSAEHVTVPEPSGAELSLFAIAALAGLATSRRRR